MRRHPAKKIPSGKELTNVVGLEENVLWKLNPLSSGSPERDRGESALSRTFRATTCVLGDWLGHNRPQ